MLRTHGITTKLRLRLHIHRDGRVKAAKLLDFSCTAATEALREQVKRATVSAAVAAIRGWTFAPSTLDGQPISVWHNVTVEFVLAR